MKEVVIVDGVRTPIGVLGGALKDVSAQELAATAMKELLKRNHLKGSDIDEVILGCVAQSSDAPNIARVASLLAGLPKEVVGYTVARNCSSGMQALVNAYQNIQCGDADIQLVGGTESMSRIPYINRDIRFGKRMRDSVMVDGLMEGLTDPVCHLVMGQTAEVLAEEFQISRKEQDEFAVQSHRKAFKAQRENKFKEEIVPVWVPKHMMGKAMPPEPVYQDEGINIALTEQALASYPAVFKEGGSVTPGNACGINDGAAMLLVMSEEKARALSFPLLGYIRSYAFVGVEPERMGIGPAMAIPKAIQKAHLQLDDLQLVEINEAFAAQVLSVDRILHLKRDILNMNGGAIALGHPVGMTGARLVLTALREMVRKNFSLSVISMCVGGGLGGAMVLERKN
jgi:acetyl-CoA C-acetyltransferase